MMDYGWFGGMHMLWWIFWVAVIVLFFVFLDAEPKHKARRRGETPLDILQRRYVAGEITTEEYTERKTRLGEDTPTENSDRL